MAKDRTLNSNEPAEATSMSENLLTLAERSGYAETGRIEEVERLAAEIAAQWAESVRSLQYARSAQGGPMRALVASRCGTLLPGELRARNIPVLMIQGGIHPGESDGKDAGFIALRELLQGDAANALERIAVLFVPAFNADGHERFCRVKRPKSKWP